MSNSKPNLTNIISPADVVIIAGRPKSGVSILATQLAMSIDAGQPWLGYETAAAGVLYAAGDSAPGALSWQPKRSKRLTLDGAKPFKAQFDSMVREHNAGVKAVVFDGLMDAFPDVSADDGRALREGIRQTCTFPVMRVFTHQTGTGDVGSPFDLIRGGDDLRHVAGVCMVLERKSDKAATLHIEGRAFKAFTVALSFDAARGWQVNER